MKSAQSPLQSVVSDSDGQMAVAVDDQDTIALEITPPTPDVPPASGIVRQVVSFVVLLLVIAAVVLLWWQQDFVLDWLRLRGYHPAANISRLADETTMTTYGERLFYVNHPAIEDRDAFNTHCTSSFEREVAVLGCYTGDRRGIYVYNVSDARLSGIQQVTAAHEMLHQAYDRLSAAERKRVNGLLEAYAKTVTDPELIEKIDLYKKTEPHDVANEMHSVYGTEVAKLPAELEAYYTRYFTSRSNVVAFHAQYEAAFSERTAKIAQYTTQLDQLKTDIEAKRSSLSQQEATINTERAKLDAYLKSERIDEYNAAVPPYNQLLAQYKSAITLTNGAITRYNAVLDELNAISVEKRQLMEAQDSKAQSTPQP